MLKLQSSSGSGTRLEGGGRLRGDGGGGSSDEETRDLRQRLQEEASLYRRRLDTYRQAQQNQAALVSRLQAKVSRIFFFAYIGRSSLFFFVDPLICDKMDSMKHEFSKIKTDLYYHLQSTTLGKIHADLSASFSFRHISTYPRHGPFSLSKCVPPRPCLTRGNKKSHGETPI